MLIFEWSALYKNFKNGDPTSVSAISATVGIILNFITSIFIILSFNSQRKFNTQQMMLNQLVLDRRRKEVFPLLTVVQDIERHENEIFKFSIAFTEADAYNVRIKSIPESACADYVLTRRELSFSIWRKSKSHTISCVKNPCEKIKSYKLFEITFNDAEGRLYFQEGNLQFDGELSISTVTLIKNIL